MREVTSKFPPGVVITPTSGTPRFQEFFLCLDRLLVPAGTGRPIFSESCEIAAGLDASLAGVKDKPEWEWAFFLGDDHTFQPDILLNLLRHDLDAVCPLNVSRHSPFGPIILQGELGPTMTQISWKQVPPPSLWTLPTDMYTGQAGLLIKRHVLARMEPPYFRVGQYQPGRLNEDIYFNEVLRSLGVPTTIDLTQVMGHLNNFAATPTFVNGSWHVAFQRHGRAAFIAEVA